MADAQRKHVETENETLEDLLKANGALTQRLADMVAEVHAATCGGAPPRPGVHDGGPAEAGPP